MLEEVFDVLQVHLTVLQHGHDFRFGSGVEIFDVLPVHLTLLQHGHDFRFGSGVDPRPSGISEYTNLILTYFVFSTSSPGGQLLTSFGCGKADIACTHTL